MASATGTITFASGGATLCTVNVATDTSCDTSALLDPARYPVTATYAGDANHRGFVDTTAFDVTKAPAPITATATPASVVFGNAVTLSATEPAGRRDGHGRPSRPAPTTLCTVDLTSGTSCLTSASLDPATYPVTATYSGDAALRRATDTTTFTVTAQATAVGGVGDAGHGRVRHGGLARRVGPAGRGDRHGDPRLGQRRDLHRDPRQRDQLPDARRRSTPASYR